MRLAINEGYFRKIYGSDKRLSLEESARICKDGGFDCIDLGMTSPVAEQNLILRTDYIGEAKKYREYCDKININVIQTHARYDFYNLDRENYISDMIKTVEVSKLLGAECVVVHADTYYDKEYRFDYKNVLEIIYDVYAPMVEAAKKQGIKIAMETLFEDRAPSGKRARFTSYVEELNDIVSKYNDPIVGICWDFGHARVSHGDSQFKEMEKVGDKIISTHVHDNYGENDLHLLPFLGKTDWTEGMKTLKKIDYKGDLTFEVVYGCFPDELQNDFLSLCKKTGSYLINEFLMA